MSRKPSAWLGPAPLLTPLGAAVNVMVIGPSRLGSSQRVLAETDDRRSDRRAPGRRQRHSGG
jgi:hypothetical protein